MTTFERTASYFPARRLSLLLTIIAIALWSFSLTQARLKLDGYGLIHSYPVSFFIALGLLTIASAILWFSPENHGKLLFLQLFFLIASLWLTPLLIGGIGNAQPGYTITVADMGNSEYIIRHGHFYPELTHRFCWPGLFIFASVISEILALNNFNLMIAVFPFFCQFIMLLPLYVIFKNTLGKAQKNYQWGALWIFYACSWANPGNLHTQSMASFFILTMIAILTGTTVWQSSREFASRLNSILLIGALTITHFLTSIYAVILTTALYIVKRLKTPTLIMLGAVLVATWLFYVATVIFEANLASFMHSAFRVDQFWSGSVVGRISGSQEHENVVRIRLATTIIFGLIALAGFIVGYRRKSANDQAMIAIALSAGVVGVVIGIAYAYELANRIFLFAALPMTYFATKLLSKKITAVILVVLLIIVLPIHIISHYGNQYGDYSSPSTITSWNFFHDRTNGGGVVGSFPFGFMKNIEQYRAIPFTFDEFEFQEGLYDALLGKGEDEVLYRLLQGYPHYYCLNKQDQAFFTSTYNDTHFISNLENRLESTKSFEVIYINPDVTIYIEEGAR